MTEEDEAVNWHARFGAEAFNASWELIDKSDRTGDENVDMLVAAAASRWHKGQIGRPDLVWMGEWQVSHVASLLGMTDLALSAARRSLEIAEREGWDGWRLGSAHEGMARACAAAGDRDGRERHIDHANAALAREPEEDERTVIAGQLATIPDV
ncbi:MAG TPA: hypothetical protein VMY88_02025 [Acidimicrobiales bacterium]|nr:hypothetical protein [Acidimicrobiales bacterium]